MRLCCGRCCSCALACFLRFQDLVAIASPNPNEDINQGEMIPDLATKYAQRGPTVAEVQLAALFAKVPLLPKDETLIIDPLPFVGDRALGTYQFLRSAAMEGRGKLRHVVVKLGSANQFVKAAAYTEQRLRTRFTKDWLARSLVLHEMQSNSAGLKVEVPVFPCEAVPPPSDEQLHSLPGAWAAHRGLAGLKLLACGLRGPKVVILPERLAEFQGAPLDVQDAVDSLRSTHEKEYEDLLSGMLQPKDPEVPGQDGTPKDGRGGDPNEDPTAKAAELVEYDSEEVLRANVRIVAETKSAYKSIHLLRDDKEVFYLVARADDEVLPIGTHLGGVGGGTVLDADVGQKRCFPWRFAEGDKTWVQLNRVASEDDSSKAPKFSGGTLYSIVRELEANAPAPPKLTAFGQLTPSGAAGRHQYVFEFPEDHEKHKAVAFVPTPPGPGAKSTVQANNFFAGSLHRDSGVGQGALSVCWRLQYDTVNNSLKPVKPFVVTGKRIALKKGRPVRAAWPAA